MNIGVVDVISHKIDYSLNTKILNPIKSSIGAQSIACWLEELGHNVKYISFTGSENIIKEFSNDLDILFISSYTHTAYLAISISTYFRSVGVITVLGGPHARAFTEDSKNYFDFIIGLCDKNLLRYLLSISKEKSPSGTGQYLFSDSQPNDFPSIKQRWKYIVYNYKKIPTWANFPIIVPSLTSTGCPYSCDFCVDSSIPYKSLDLNQLKEDIIFLKEKIKNGIAGILFYDPNLGIGINKRIEIIKTHSSNNIKFLGEMNLTTMSPDIVLELSKIGFIALAPGIESWTSYHNKSIGDCNKSKLDKVNKTSDKINFILNHIPLLQANLIFGMDCDSGQEPFLLTKEFIKQTPRAVTNFQTITAFGGSALSRKMKDENRLIDLPYFLMDGFSSTNIKLNYNLSDFYLYYSDIVKFSNSNFIFAKKILSSSSFAFGLFHTLRKCSRGRGSHKYYKKLSNYMKTVEFESFYNGDSKKPPEIYHNLLKTQLKSFYNLLPEKIIDYFEGKKYCERGIN